MRSDPDSFATPVLDYDENRTWIETPRMRWRVLGFRTYLREILWSMARFALGLGLLVMVLSLRTNPFWHWQGMRMVLIVVGFGCALRLLIECVPGSVTFSRQGCIYNGRTRKRQRRFEWASCQNVRWTDLPGLKRLDVDIPGKRGGVEHVTLAVPTKHVAEIEWILAEVNKPAPALPEGPIPLNYVPATFSMYQPPAFGFGVIMIGMSVVTAGALLWRMATGTAGANLIAFSVLVFGALGTCGALALRYGLPWFHEQVRIGEKMRARERLERSHPRLMP